MPECVERRAIRHETADDWWLWSVNDREQRHQSQRPAIAKASGAIGAALGGPAAPITGTIGAILGAILMSDAGKKLAGGAYTALNPRGELDHYIRQLDKQKEYQLARDSINRELAMTRAKDQQTMDLEAAVLNKLLGN